MTIEGVVAAIRAGELDEGLAALAEAIQVRKVRKNQFAFGPGDKAKIGKIRPRYLQGAVVTVEKVNQATALCRFDDPLAAGKFGTRPVRIPLACLEAL